MKSFTCIVCPLGCALTVNKNKSKIEVSGNKCKKGIEYAINEMTNPKRVLCTTVKTSFDNFPRLPVRAQGEIPLVSIFDAMKEINKIIINKRMKPGDIIVDNFMNFGVQLIATADMR